MLSGTNLSLSDEVNRQSSAIAKRREQLRRWDESETNRQSTNIKLSQRVKFEQAYIFLAACSSEDRDEIDKLLQRGVDINTSNIDGLTALHQTCIDNNLHMVEYLLNKNAEINCQDNEGWTPLHAAASCGNLDIVKYLLSRGAIVDVCNNEGELAIDIAEGDDIIAYLEEDMRRKGIDDQQSRNYEHQLMIKHAQDSLNNNKNGLKSTADAIVHSRTGATALHVAAAKGYLDVIDLLIRAGANLNSVDNDGWTPLHAAAHWDKHDILKYLVERNANIDAKNYAGQTPLDVCDGETLELLKELKAKQPPVKNEPKDVIKRTLPSPAIDEQRSILRSESHNENLDKIPKPTQPSIDENLSNCSPNLKEKLNNLQRSLHDLSNRYSRTSQDESTPTSNTLLNSFNKQNSSSLSILNGSLSRFGTKYSLSTSQRIYTNPLQSLTTINLNNNDSFNRFDTIMDMPYEPLILSRPITLSSIEHIQQQHTNFNNNKSGLRGILRRWGTTDRTVGGDIPNNTGPYVRRRSGAGINEPTPSAAPSTIVSVTSSLPPPTTNVTVTSFDDPTGGKRRSNRDDEAEAQRKHRSAQARRERRSTQSVSVEDIKAAEQQIKNRPNEIPSINNKIGAPSTPLANEIETERLQKVIEEKKDKARKGSGNEDTNEINTDISSRRLKLDDVPTVIANDSLTIGEPRRRTNRVHTQRKNTGKIIWNDETKEVEILDETTPKLSSEGSDDQQAVLTGSRGLVSRFENSSKDSKLNRSQSQEPLKKSLSMSNSLPTNGINSIKENNDTSAMKLYDDAKRKMEELNQKIDRYERDIIERDQIIEKLKTSQYIESSLDKREKRAYERKISELEEDLKKMDSIKSDNTRLKEENAALIRVISKLSK
ncbi:unnamed protein product [Adineta steineri]|uniref:cGMP-dependent protein kinase interacting domain-containing protein n=1 Tax=Adineta steineri TaxID=433720 RepID=A0A819FMH1_9BILA|nr:unnamed protein product [Adineta steineri]